MPAPIKELAPVLERARASATGNVVRGPDLSGVDRQLLLKRGFLIEIIKGWYALTTPQADPGETTFWHAHFWGFASAYLRHRFATDYCLSADNSLDLWTGNFQTPKNVIAITRKGGRNTLHLPNGTTILTYDDPKNLPAAEETHGLLVMPLAMALVRIAPTYFRLAPTKAEIALRLVRPEELTRVLLTDAATYAAAGRMLGALTHCGLVEIADRIEADLVAAGIKVTKTNPFDTPPRLPTGQRLESPHVGRLEALWHEMRPTVAKLFPKAPTKKPDALRYLEHVEEIYTHDAYNSLSIEGYQVTPDLISRIAEGKWNPDVDGADGGQRDAMAARGYREAFKNVLKSLRPILNGKPASDRVRRDLPDWYRALFSPSVQAGILPAYALAGVRDRAVFIRGSDYVPPPHTAVQQLLDALFALLAAEPHPGVQAVLGHFLFVYIHPYSDGNGRIGRFLLNAFFAAGGYPWTVIRVERRKQYLAALEQASVHHDISAFTRFVAEELTASAKLKGSSPVE